MLHQEPEFEAGVTVVVLVVSTSLFSLLKKSSPGDEGLIFINIQNIGEKIIPLGIAYIRISF